MTAQARTTDVVGTMLWTDNFTESHADNITSTIQSLLTTVFPRNESLKPPREFCFDEGYGLKTEFLPRVG